MTTIYEIEVFGQGYENVESNGGWQVLLRTTNYEEAENTLLTCFETLGWDNVSWNYSSKVATDFEDPTWDFYR